MPDHKNMRFIRKQHSWKDNRRKHIIVHRVELNRKRSFNPKHTTAFTTEPSKGFCPYYIWTHEQFEGAIITSTYFFSPVNTFRDSKSNRKVSQRSGRANWTQMGYFREVIFRNSQWFWKRVWTSGRNAAEKNASIKPKRFNKNLFFLFVKPTHLNYFWKA